MTGPGGEVLFEFHRVGSYMKVTAIDAQTGVEVSVAGPASGSVELLKRTAMNKLRYVQTRDAPKPGAKPGR
ncbi:DUF6898 family protein [Azospirillum agricola]|uniref:DUF6898 family protein n=1 Tax=Azospirillum agricola TaxID=1720247 RepID=UPI000A0F1623|nr:hypothetical protein [Azospirillum agricola]MBP2230349.1 hypothetical protein [Azospirillum agricola]SMH52524.1 hypothetical protein SAMN02982994_3158 [Azospirillum lipoferum]